MVLVNIDWYNYKLKTLDVVHGVGSSYTINAKIGTVPFSSYFLDTNFR